MAPDQTYIQALIPPIVVQAWNVLHHDLPSPVFVINDDWVFGAGIRYAPGQSYRPFLTVPFIGCDVPLGTPITAFIDGLYCGDKPVELLSLIPDTPAREEEARTLGDIIQQKDGFYLVQRPGQRVWVCEKRDVSSYAVGEDPQASIVMLR